MYLLSFHQCLVLAIESAGSRPLDSASLFDWDRAVDMPREFPDVANVDGQPSPAELWE